MPPHVQIEHRGVAEVEEALAEPDKPTTHFAPINTITVYGNVSGGQFAVAGRDVSQSITYDKSQSDEIRRLLDEYRSALPELDGSVRTVAQQQLDQVAAEVEKAQPHPAIVNGLLGSLKSFAQNGVAAAGAGAGTMGLAEVLAHWPF